jgi:hypothetical protein
MKVPINPQTNVATGELDYEKPVDATAGTRLLGEVVSKWGEYAQQQQKKRELFDVEQKVVDETNALQTDFDAKKTAQPLGAPNFVQQVNGEYNTRHMAMVADLKKQGYSQDALNEFQQRLGTIRAQYVAQAIDFETKSNFSKTVNDADKMSISLSQYAQANPNAVESALSSLRTGLSYSGLDQPEQEQIYNSKKGEITKAAQTGFAIQHPEIVLGLYGLNKISTVNYPDGTNTTITTQAIKPSGGLADNIVQGLKNRGLPDAKARGVGAGIYSESSNKVDALGPKVTRKSDGRTDQAYGLGQWIFERKDALFAKYGPHPTGSQQLDFLVAELNGGDAGGKFVLAQADEEAVLHSYIHDFMRPGKAGEQSDLKNGLAALGRQIADHATATAAALTTPTPIPANWRGNQEDAIRELGMTADQAAIYLSTGKDTRATPPTELAKNGQPVVQVDENGQTGMPVLDTATGEERVQMLTVARTIMNEREADTKAANKLAHDTWLNNFYNGLEDGKLGQSDLNSAYANGQITDFDERSKAQGILDSKNKKNEDFARYELMLASGQKFNPYDNDAQKAVDAGFENAVRYSAKHGNVASPEAIALRAWQRTGILPKAGAIMIRGGLISTDPRQVAAAASVANNMIRENPNAFAGQDGREEIEHAAVAYGHYIYDLGMSPQEAANKVAGENDPKFKEKFKYNDPATQETLKNLRLNGVNAAQAFKGAAFPNQDALNEANQTYYELLRDQLNRGVDFGTATAQVQAQMQKVYGVNSNGRIVKYPPERAYPQINGRWDYIYHDAQKTVKDETGRDPIQINLAPIPGVTDEDFRQGRLARYRIIYSYKSGEHTVIDSVPGQFAADINSARKTASAQNRRDFAKARDSQVATQQTAEEMTTQSYLAGN